MHVREQAAWGILEVEGNQTQVGFLKVPASPSNIRLDWRTCFESSFVPQLSPHKHHNFLQTLKQQNLQNACGLQ